MTGLAFMKTSDAISSFVRQAEGSGRRRAILCTYDFDPVRFEAVIQPELSRRRKWFRTLVLADGAAIQKDGVLERRTAGASYELSPVRVHGSGVFHAKLILLQAGRRFLVGVGSGNLTPGGLGGNLELMLFGSTETADGKALSRSATQFLRELLVSRHVRVASAAARFIDRVCHSVDATADGPLLHNLREPLLTQMAAGGPRSVKRVVVVSPWHSTTTSTEGVEPKVLAAVGEALGRHPSVFTQGEGGKGPALGRGTKVHVLRTGLLGDEDELDIESDVPRDQRPLHSARLHAKAYLAVGGTSTALWVGSANCTTPALKRVAGHGNVELLARLALDAKALVRLESDLASMFKPARGVLPARPTPRVPSPRGLVLAGYVGKWHGLSTLVLEVMPPSAATPLRIGVAAVGGKVVEVLLPERATSVVADTATVLRLFDGRPTPSVLWERVGRRAIPFPVSVPCVPASDDPEDVLQDALDDLAGRVPVPFRHMTHPDDIDGAKGAPVEERDRELELLTASEHEGVLDRVAVRVELLRRRVAEAKSNDMVRYYSRVTQGLQVAPALRRVLLEHLQSRKRSA